MPSVASLYGQVALRQENSYFSIGERCNANGSKKWRELQEKGDWDGCVVMGREQISEGSNSLDVCTAFVGRNEIFQKFVAETARIALDTAADMTKIAAAPFPGSGRDVQGELTNMIATIGENMSLRRAASLSVSDGVVAAYMHNSVAPDLGKIGVLVALESTGDKAKLTALAKQLAMHVAAAKPKSLTVADLDKATIERERGVLAEKAAQSGKAVDIIAKPDLPEQPQAVVFHVKRVLADDEAF